MVENVVSVFILKCRLNVLLVGECLEMKLSVLLLCVFSLLKKLMFVVRLCVDSLYFVSLSMRLFWLLWIIVL